MNNILILAFLFFAGCLIGWGIEVIFRRFEPSNKARKWINPGFLIGPYLPLYGFGLCTLYLLAGLEKFIHTDNTALQKFILFFAYGYCNDGDRAYCRRDIHCENARQAVGLYWKQIQL